MPAEFLGGKWSNYEQIQRFFYGYYYNIAQKMGIFGQYPALDTNPSTGTANFRAIEMIENQWKQWSPTANPVQQQVDIDAGKLALASDTDLDIAFGYYQSFFTGPPVIFPPLTAPTLWLFGENDGFLLWRSQLTPAELTTEVLARSPPGSEVYISKCGGHFLNLDETEEVNKRILAFIE